LRVYLRIQETHIPFGTPKFLLFDIVEGFAMTNEVQKLVLLVFIVDVQMPTALVQALPLVQFFLV
jgi:hypothetical protein